MVILGIETSCDETAAAVVEETGDASRPWRVLSNVVASQVDIHREWGGVVPELSARQHIRDICGVVERAVEDAGSPRYDAIAVTQGPGLVGSLLVGLSFAKALAWARGVPLVPVHHLAGHVESLVLGGGEMPMPAVVLVVSGGHTSLYLVPRPGVFERLGRTRDDAAGEAYDKVARLLGLGYPGGPVIDRLAAQGNDRAVAVAAHAAHPCGSQRPTPAGTQRFQLQRPEDLGAASPAAAARAARPGRRRPAADRRRRGPVRQLPAGGGGVAARPVVRGGARRSRRTRSASPEASRPTAGCARTRWPAAQPPDCRSSSRRWRSRPTTPP